MQDKRRIYIASDSTVRDYDKTQYPQAGWGQFLRNYMPDDMIIKNHAVGGKSSKTFITEGYFDSILSEIRPDDYLFIQFGHNDSTRDRPERVTEPYEDYKKYLNHYIDQARLKKAIPILFTPVAILHYVKDEFLVDFGDYCNAMKEVAVEKDVQLVDLMKHSITYLTTIGYEEAKKMYMISVNGTDCVHFTEEGADKIAQLVYRELTGLQIV